MPNKKTGARKKKERQKNLQLKKKDLVDKIRGDQSLVNNITEVPCNTLMVCDQCNRSQKNRAFCYFCKSIQRVILCANCGKMKCVTAGGDCLVKHVGNNHAKGLQMVGAICDFCEAWVCHSRRCIQNHGKACLLRDSNKKDSMSVKCVECTRDVWSHGGRVFRCSTCRKWCCEDDANAHIAMCQTLAADNDKCASCNSSGTYVCLRCKIVWCDSHVEGSIKAKRGEPLKCKKCRYELADAKDLSLSTRRHEYGRHTHTSESHPSSNYATGDAGGSSDESDATSLATFTFGGRPAI